MARWKMKLENMENTNELLEKLEEGLADQKRQNGAQLRRMEDQLFYIKRVVDRMDSKYHDLHTSLNDIRDIMLIYGTSKLTLWLIMNIPFKVINEYILSLIPFRIYCRWV